MKNVAKVMDLLENTLPDINDEFYRINSGGCGIMAQILAENLDKLEMEYNVVCQGGRGFDDEDNLSNKEVNDLIDNSSKNMPNSHILIEIEGRYFDSNGEQTVRMSSITALIDLPTIRRMNKMDCWNSSFDRSQVKAMREYANIMFDEQFGSVSGIIRNINIFKNLMP